MLDDLAWRLLDAIRRTGARRVVVDGIGGFVVTAAYEERDGSFLAAFANALRVTGATSMVTLEQRALGGDTMPLSGAHGEVDRTQAVDRQDAQQRLRPVGPRRAAVRPGLAIAAGGRETPGRRMNATTVSAARILVVDDEVSSAEVVALVLSEEGHDVSFAVDPRRALALLEQREFDLLITDYMMPGMDGAELARAARATGRHERLAVVMMSGASWLALQDHADTFDVFLRKPFVIDQLLLTVQSLLDKGGPRPEVTGRAA